MSEDKAYGPRADGNGLLLNDEQLKVITDPGEDIEQLHTENTAQAQEILELKAYVNELRDVLDFKKWRDTDDLAWIKAHGAAINRTPAQSLTAHNAAMREELTLKERSSIEDEVIEACADVCADMSNTDGDKAEQAIRNMPRKYKESKDES